MQDDSLFFQVKTIGLSNYKGRKPQSLLDAARHNRRQIQAELGARGRIDPTRTCLNKTLVGPTTPEGVVGLAQSLMADAKYAPNRYDYVQSIELLFSLPASSTIDSIIFFGDCLKWVTAQFGSDVVLSADVHFDESAPHLHVLLAPIAGGRYLGSKLITRMVLTSLRESFAELAMTYGLREPIRRLHGAIRERATCMVLEHLESTGDPLLQSALWFAVKSDIVSNPARYAARLGIELPRVDGPARKTRSMAQIFTSAGKGAKTERDSKSIGFELQASVAKAKPIGFEMRQAIDLKNTETIALLVSAKNTSSLQPSLAQDGMPATNAQSAQKLPLLDSRVQPIADPPPSQVRNTDAENAGPCREACSAAVLHDPDCAGAVPVATTSSIRSHSEALEPTIHRPAIKAAHPEHGDAVETTRERDGDRAAEHWCPDTGEFVITPPSRPTPPKQGGRAAADEWVNAGLEELGRKRRLRVGY